MTGGRIVFATVCAALLALPASAQTAPSIDDDFIVAAVQGGNAEIDMAKLELRAGKGDEAMSFAKRMLEDHPPIGARLARIVPGAASRAKERLGTVDRIAYARLSTLGPTDLDQQYIVQQVGDHLATVSVFTAEAETGRQSALRAFAKSELPLLREHLQVALGNARDVAGDNPLRTP